MDGGRGTYLGRIFAREGCLVYVGPIPPNECHSHHVFQIIVALDHEMSLSDATQTATPCTEAVIPPNTPHFVIAPSVAMLLLDPESTQGRRLTRTLPRAESSADWPVLAVPLRALTRFAPSTWAEATRFADEVLRALTGDSVRPRPMHPAVTRVLRAIPKRLDRELRVTSLAREAGLSAGRLSHLFSESVGVPLRQYVLWSRLILATRHIQQGDSLAAAAASAGFADGAHLSHTFRRMLGVAPSTLVGAFEWVLRPGERELELATGPGRSQ